MNIYKLSWKNIQSRPLYSFLSILLISLGVGLISLILNVSDQIKRELSNNIQGIDMVVGAKGSPLQLILSAVFHIDSPTGNIDLPEVEKLKRNRLISQVIPLSFGDTYQGYRIVGTDKKYIELYNGVMAEGDFFEREMEVVVGSKVAALLKLSIGDTFLSSHGLVEGGETHESSPFIVVGILSRSGSVLDQLIITRTESIWEVHAHEDEDHDERASAEPEETRQVTAALIKFRSPMGLITLPRSINQDTNMQAALPAYEINRLVGLLGVGIDSLIYLGAVIMFVSGLSVFISLYSSFSERKYELAMMRSFGASKTQLFQSIVQEGFIISFIGVFVGIVLSKVGLLLVTIGSESEYHYSLNSFLFISEEYILCASTLVIGIVAAFIPAIQVYKVNISKILSEG